ncbi:MAG TPA: RNA polymerase subunit sigma-70 [Myxococcales bacterium]|nr:RNA polymerase subunit sigma-70 [Myxococcales bacterium]
MSSRALIDHFFRHEYGRLVSTLSRRVGVEHLEAVEDAAQSALMAALETWTKSELPANPSAWLFRAAINELLGGLRKGARRRRILERLGPTSPTDPEPIPTLSGEMQDDLLRMLFVCCDDAIPQRSQLVLALKVLSGFDVREIALRLFTSEANVYKRLTRARARLRSRPLDLDALDSAQHAARLPAVLAILHLLFTEGYLSHHAEHAIRGELSDEAIRLATLLAAHPVGRRPETFALVALMHLHGARMDARVDAAGSLLLLEEQDRSRWDAAQVSEGLSWLAASSDGDVLSRYHVEAGIAAEHCLAPSFAETRWDRVVELYGLLRRIAPSEVHELNRAVAVAEWKSPAAGLRVLDALAPSPALAASYQWAAVQADLHRRAGRVEEAARHRAHALEAAPTPAVEALLRRRLGRD